MPSSYYRYGREFAVRLAPLGHSLHQLASMQVKLTSSNLFGGFAHTAPSYTPKVLLTIYRRVRDW